MGERQNTDHNAVKTFCVRLGVDYPCDGKLRDLNHEVLRCLSRDVITLASLAEKHHVSLYELSANRLLPTIFRSRIFENTTNTKPEYREAYFYRDIGQLTNADREKFQKLPRTGNGIIGVFDYLRELHNQTSGFRTLLSRTLDLGEQEALIKRVTESVRADPKMERRLYAMFPPAAPQ